MLLQGHFSTSLRCALGASLTLGCLDDPLTEESLSRPDAAVLGSLKFNLEASDIPPISVLAVRIVNLTTGVALEDRTVNLNYETLDLQLELPPGEYMVGLRGVTTKSQVCAGDSRFEVFAGQLARVESTVVCDPEVLSVGQAKLTVATLQGDIIGTTSVNIDQLQLVASSFVELAPGRYVVWVTASTEQGEPCAGSTELLIEAGKSKTFDLEVVCER